MAKRESGGKRAVEAKHRQRAARRGRGYVAASIAGFEKAHRRAQRHPKNGALVLAEAIEMVREALFQAATDPGLPPEQRREQVGRLGACLIKAADPKRMIDELGAELRDASAALEQLREQQDAAQEPARDQSGAPKTAPH